MYVSLGYILYKIMLEFTMQDGMHAEHMIIESVSEWRLDVLKC